MTFEYGDYLQQCFSKYLPSLLIFGAGFLYLLIGSLRLVRKGDFKRWLLAFSATMLFPTLICLLLFVPSIISMTRTGGIHLPFEMPEDVCTATGIIQKLEPEDAHASTRCKFHWNGKTVYGTWLTIEDERYFAVSAGDLAAGDAVIIEYLPKSRCVMYIGDGSSLPCPVVTPQESADATEAAIAAIPPVTAMTFPFEDYQRIVLFEAGLCIVLVIIAAHTVFSAAKKLLRHKLKLAEGLQTLLSIFTFALLLVVGCSSVWNSGWRLLLEEPAEAVTVRGEIQSIEVLGSYDGVKFSTEWGTQFGCYVTIDGTAYFAMYEGDLTAGDMADVTYLPQSHYILSISANEE